MPPKTRSREETFFVFSSGGPSLGSPDSTGAGGICVSRSPGAAAVAVFMSFDLLGRSVDASCCFDAGFLVTVTAAVV